MDIIVLTPPSQYANALSCAVFHANAFHRIFSNVIYMTAVAQASVMFGLGGGIATQVSWGILPTVSIRESLNR